MLETLRRAGDARVEYERLEDAGLDPGTLIREGLADYAASTFRHPDCHHRCDLVIDVDSRSAEGLIGVSCPIEPACWPGWDWVQMKELRSLRCRAEPTLKRLARLNGLGLLESVPSPFVPVGRLRQRGLDVAVIWARWLDGTLRLALEGVRRRLGGDGLILLVSRGLKMDETIGGGVALLMLHDSDDGDLGLVRGLDLIDPEYRERVLADALLDLDFVRLRFATVPGVRHELYINDELFPGFQSSDLRFLRLLRLAAARKFGRDDGWVDRAEFRGASEKDREIGELRTELRRHTARGTTVLEREALIRTRRGKGLVRLGVPPEGIELDESLRDLRLLSEGRTSRSTADQRAGARNAAVLLEDVRRMLGGEVPG